MARDWKAENSAELSNAESPLQMDVFTADGEYIGRISHYLDEVPDDVAGLEDIPVDILDRSGKRPTTRRVFIDCHGTPLQSELIMPLAEIALDFRGRRATLPFTMQQLREIPHSIPFDREAPPLNR